MNFKRFKNRSGFTLAEILITLGIIGVVAAMTIPTLMKNSQERECVSGLLKFNSTLQQAVQMWKVETCGGDDAYNCLLSQGLADGDKTNFDQIKKYLKVIKNRASDGASWLPNDTLDYYGNSNSVSYGKVSKTHKGDEAFLLNDGTTFSIDVNPAGFIITADVNGAKPPNRFGKDTFDFIIGSMQGKDIYYGPYDIPNSNANGQCSIIESVCNPDNTDPTKDNGASLTAYVIMHHKLPDFKALSQNINGFKP